MKKLTEGPKYTFDKMQGVGMHVLKMGVAIATPLRLLPHPFSYIHFDIPKMSLIKTCVKILSIDTLIF